MTALIKYTNNPLGGGRIAHVDSLKGILIVLVIIGHSNVNLIIPCTVSAIYSIHMPLFFILSGFFINKKRHLREHINKSFKAYIRPYLYTCMVGVALLCIKWFLTGDLKYDSLLKDYLQRILFVQTARTTDIGPIWFLIALFWGQNILVFLISKLSIIQLFCCVITLPLCAIMIADEIFVPFSLFQGLTAIPFLYTGLLLKSNKSFLEYLAKNRTCLVLIGTMWIIYVSLGNVMRICFVYFPYGFTSYIISILSSLVIFYYSRFIDCKWLRAIGRHTLLILCVHTLVLPYILKIGALHSNAFYISLEVIADISISLMISFTIVKIKRILIHEN